MHFFRGIFDEIKVTKRALRLHIIGYALLFLTLGVPFFLLRALFGEPGRCRFDPCANLVVIDIVRRVLRFGNGCIVVCGRFYFLRAGTQFDREILEVELVFLLAEQVRFLEVLSIFFGKREQFVKSGVFIE